MIAEKNWVRGLVAGIVGATVMALWFLIIDASQGAPFRTPGLLAHSLLGVEGLEGRPGAIALYTLLHYAAFVVVGVVSAWTLKKMEVAPSLLLGLLVGFILFDLVFFTSMGVTGVDVVAELGWVEVLVGNLMAGVTIMGYLHFTGAVRAVTWWEALADHRIVREGLVAGLVGAGTVAVWFLVVDSAQGRPLFTPAALGSAIFLGASDLAMVEVNLWTVAGYTVLHLLAFSVVGLVAAAITVEAERTPALILGAVLLFVAFEAFFLGLLAVVAEFLLGPLAWWTIAVGNLLAVLSIGFYLWKKHPLLRAAFAADPFDRTA
ncbi:MAG: hypothetical protein EA421_05460 [Gemmatimonadales bacterium]|nr:MAG: hypothetical protein EA421_05460 [Gemmatimonadales bacterium]